MNFFTPEELSIISNAKKVVVAFSGGPDSTLALLATKQNLKDSSKLSALHINHQAQTASSEWEQDCEKLCQKLSIAYESVKVKVKVEDQVVLKQQQEWQDKRFFNNLKAGRF